MNIIELAEQAGFKVKNFKTPVITAQHSNGSWVSVGDELETFARLVIEAHVKGVDMEPVGFQWFDTANFRKRLPDDALPSDWRVLYTATQMAAQRHKVLEDAIESIASFGQDQLWSPHQLRKYIHALKEKA
jgi:hypothetical protein